MCYLPPPHIQSEKVYANRKLKRRSFQNRVIQQNMGNSGHSHKGVREL